MYLSSACCDGFLFRNLDIVTVQTHCLAQLKDMLWDNEA